MKGVSPVVATVLLIAIAVIAAVGVWFFVQNMTSKQTGSPSMMAMGVEGCTLNASGVAASLTIRNLADTSLVGTTFQVFDSTSTTNVSSFTSTMVKTGEFQTVSLGAVTGMQSAGTYTIKATNLPTVTFSCPK